MNLGHTSAQLMANLMKSLGWRNSFTARIGTKDNYLFRVRGRDIDLSLALLGLSLYVTFSFDRLLSIYLFLFGWGAIFT